MRFSLPWRQFLFASYITVEQRSQLYLPPSLCAFYLIPRSTENTPRIASQTFHLASLWIFPLLSVHPRSSLQRYGREPQTFPIAARKHLQSRYIRAFSTQRDIASAQFLLFELRNGIVCIDTYGGFMHGLEKNEKESCVSVGYVQDNWGKTGQKTVPQILIIRLTST